MKMIKPKVRAELQSKKKKNTNSSIKLNDSRICFWHGYVSSYWIDFPIGSNKFKANN